MKTIQNLVLALCATLLMSCTGMPPVPPMNIPVPGGQLVFGGGGGQQGGYNPYQQGYTNNQSAGGRQIGERCYVKIGADAPQPVVQAVEHATVAKAQAAFADSCFANNGMRGEWPTFEQVTEMARLLFEAKGLSLSPGSEGTPNCFKVMEYKPALPAS